MPRLTAAQRREADKSLSDFLQVHSYISAIYAVWKDVEMYAIGVNTQRAGKPWRKADEKRLKFVTDQAIVTRDAILASAPPELVKRIKSGYKLMIKER